MREASHRMGAMVAALAVVVLSGASVTSRNGVEVELESLVTPSEREFLITQLSRVDPPSRIHELCEYGERQSDLGGGFYGMMPSQLTDPDSLPIPIGEKGRLEAGLRLALQRDRNRAALRQINPDYPTSFRNASLSDFLGKLPTERVLHRDDDAEVELRLDWSAIQGFFDALADGEVTRAEAQALASLPSNRAMLQHRRDLGYVPEPLPDVNSLAELIEMAGSPDPLNRLWCWMSTQNAFGYADLRQNEQGYRGLLTELDRHGDELSQAAIERITRFTPADVELRANFAFTVGWAIRGWATADLAGLNLEQVKDDWDFLFGTLVEETYHRLQLELFPTTAGVAGAQFADMVAARTGDERLDRLHEVVAYTVAEGAANLVRGRFALARLSETAPAGADLLARFVERVVDRGDLEAADALMEEGLKNNGPLYGLGRELARLISDHEGTRAVGRWQRRGPVAFFLHAAELAVEEERPLVDASVVAAVRRIGS